jgi:hypothetical protein
MVKEFRVIAALSASLSAFAVYGANPDTNGPAAGAQQKAPVNPGTGNTNVNGTQHRLNQKWLRAYCEDQARKQGLTGPKAKAAVAACEKS